MAPKTASDGIPALARDLETLGSGEERVDAWRGYLERHGGDFDEDSRQASQLILDDDMEGLAAHASRFSSERAAAAVARLKQQGP